VTDSALGQDVPLDPSDVRFAPESIISRDRHVRFVHVAVSDTIHRVSLGSVAAVCPAPPQIVHVAFMSSNPLLLQVRGNME
jgi:hypothetical protein